MSAFTDLRKKLAELFQLDAAAELDFGIYRILNARRVEIEGFLDSLGPQVEAILAAALQSGASDLKAELEKVEAGLRAGGIDDAMIATAPKVRELRDKLAADGGDPELLAREIFSLLTTFFSRYYKDGDFISLRRYKKDTYAIPYEGEEVKLHWANADQYYIKSAETFRDYTFRLGPAPKDDKPDQRPAVSFKLVEADIEKDNNKAAPGQERRFVFTGTADLQSASSIENLVLGFTYAPVGKKEKQGDLNAAAAEAILAAHAKGPFTALAANDPTYTVKGKTRSVLAKHLTEYTGKNSFDYFIHKDLGGFLRRELDFFIKNEVLHLDDLDEAPEASWKETRAKLKALRSIAGKIIRFLAQIEDFQKKLWLKKKFVVGCDYVVTLDRIPEELYPEIAACAAQREEWVKLFAIDEIKGDLGRTGYSEPLEIKFLKENPELPLDTQNIPTTLSSKIHQSLISVPGLCIKSENFQALRQLRSTHENKTKCIYIDPPYNTENDKNFPYKDNFEKSSWLSAIYQSAKAAWPLLTENGLFLFHIGDTERATSQLALESLSPTRKNTAVVRRGVKNVQAQFDDIEKLSLGHDVIHILGKQPGTRIPHLRQSLETENPGKWDTFWRGTDRPTMRYPLLGEDPATGQWRWEERRANRAVNQYYDYISKEAKTKTLDEWYIENLQAGLDLDFVRKNEDGVIQYYVPPQAHRLVSDNWLDISTSGSFTDFPHEKAYSLLARAITWVANTNELILDYFAGSGSTGHAVINLNREDGGDRKYILIEMGEHFDTVLVPRLKKVIYSKDWKDGKPQSRNTGVSHCFKILRLESYEDTLNNLRLHRSREQELALETFSPEAREDYQLGYMLDLEASGSQSLLNVSAFTDPFGYQLQVASGTAGETRPVQVDLVETFNWLLGLTVLAQGQGGGVTWVEGTNPDGEKVLVLWRNTAETDAEALNAWCRKQKVSVLDGEFALIYLNGDHFLENLRREDQTWKVRLTDEEFPKLMWEGCE